MYMYIVSTNAPDVSSANSGRVSSDSYSERTSCVFCMTPSCPSLPSATDSMRRSSSGISFSRATPRLSPKSSISWWPRYLGMRQKEQGCPSYTDTSSFMPRTNSAGSLCASDAKRRSSENERKWTPRAEW